MEEYTELIKALRCGEYKPECGSSDCPYWSGLGCMDGQLMEDAADAIEELQAELAGSKDAIRILKHNLEMKKPKRGEWKRDEKRWGENSIRCSLCGAVIEDEEWGWRNWNYCYHCGAKMEVQDADN